MQSLQKLNLSKTFSIFHQLNLCQIRSCLVSSNGCFWSMYKVCSSGTLTYPVCKTLCRALTCSTVVGSDRTKFEPENQNGEQVKYVKGVHPTRLPPKGTEKGHVFNSRSGGQFANRHKRNEDKYEHNYSKRQPYSKRPLDREAGRSSRQFANRDERIEDKYRQNYTESQRFTMRPLEEEDEEEEKDMLEESQNIRSNEEEVDPGDVFGTLSDKFVHRVHNTELGSKYDDEPDSDGEDWVRPRGRRNKPYWFGTQMKKLCKEGKLKEAIEMLQIRMLKEECVNPIAYNYNILIGACGRAGYTKMAFKLYNRMKERGIQPVDVTYTSLVNACAESPWPTTDGISRLRKLHGQLQEKGVNINLITYHAMMKAYAKCGDFQMTLDLFRHLLVSSPRVLTESCNFFFFACASDKEAGLTLAIQGWRYLLQRKIKPDLYTYNLLLRIARDCGIGDMEVANRVLLQRGESQDLLSLPPPTTLPHTKKYRKGTKAAVSINPERERITILPINPISEENWEDDLSDDEVGEYVDDNLERKHKFWWEEELQIDKKPPQNDPQWTSLPMAELPVAPNETDQLSLGEDVPLPNLLNASSIELEHVVSLANITTPQNRLALIGGCSGILENMKKNGVKPNIKTFGLLTELIPNKNEAQRELMVAMDAVGVKGDIDFYNGLIRMRALRRDMKGSKEILAILHDKGLFPTIKTFGNLAMGCFKPEDGLELIENMKAAGRKPNVHIFASLIGSANRVRDYGYIVKLLEQMLKHEVLPDKMLLEKLENIASFHQDKSKEAKSHGRSWTKHDENQLNNFRKYYITWLDKVKVAEEEDPWQKFRPDKYTQPRKDERDQ